LRDRAAAGGSVARPSLSLSSGVVAVDLTIWLPAMFVLGWVGLFVCLAFTEACERI
jgi:hypothetical protein